MALGFMTRRIGRSAKEQDELYEMANLFPRTTGLPMAVWVSPRGRARDDARIKVSLTPGRMDIGHTVVVGIRPEPRLIEGRLTPADLELVSRWIGLNEEVLIEFWNETIDSVELGGKLKKIWRADEGFFELIENIGGGAPDPALAWKPPRGFRLP
jgi:hypothetical protein